MIESALQKIHDAGFRLAIKGDSLMVDPGDQLTDQQRTFIRDHKAEILSALRASLSLLDSEGGNDLEPGNDADVLPPGLVEAATRVCREIHADDDKAVEAILADLRDQPDDWAALEGHFEGQIQPDPESGYERVTTEAAGYRFDVDVPAKHAHHVRRSVRYLLRDGQGSGYLLGQPGQSEAELGETLWRKYGNRLATINEQPAPVTCRGCLNAEIGLRPPIATCGLGLQAKTPAGWPADEPHHCGGFEL